MCFSVEVQKDLKKIAQKFHAELKPEDEIFYQNLKAKSNDLDFVKKALHLSRKPRSNPFKEPGADGRVFPGYFTPVMIQEKNKRLLKHMRYRIRPAGSAKEIPSEYNVFNARIDALQSRQTWKKLISKNHGILPFKRFYEWVEWDGKKRLISFAPQNRDLMWAPCLYDIWENKEDGYLFYSFAIITDDPPPEVQEMGHDRCPIFLNQDNFELWLNPKGQTVESIIELLKKKEEVFYINEWAA